MSLSFHHPRAPISLERSTPPAPANLDTALGASLVSLSQMVDINKIIRTHRFGGTEQDKARAAAWLEQRFSTSVDPRQIIQTNGAQSAMVMALASVAGPGDTVLLETLSYHGFRKQAHLQNIRTESIEMDDDGALPDAFEKACRAYKPKALFLMPTVHNPTTGVMSLERRRQISDIARKYGVALMEDDVYGVLPVDVPPPLGAIAPDVTWHITSFAKCLGPGGRIGYLVAPTPDAAQATINRFNGMSTWFSAAMSAELIGHWLDNGTMTQFVERVREEARERQQIAQKYLTGLQYRSLPESLFLWVNLDGVIDQDVLVERCAERNVIIRPGRLFSTDAVRSPNAVRVVVGSPDTREELEAALAVIGGLLGSAPEVVSSPATH
ncbi:PLP-dependent aminotransferase family protein [Sinorhizobium meliloti]|uniref:aminotransferase-like domain-containing protein n=1 Tax=Rhizobium meliloti TaxID=382 RepID=UPI0004217555|nr:PLP-dependent aminotransferase family protein [Sinorhizobium meliloti]MDE4615956.1 PLP-dependent aminotransferase family protein [Sinorhizobium meliloti]